MQLKSDCCSDVTLYRESKTPICPLHAAAPALLAIVERLGKVGRITHTPLPLGTRIEINALVNEARAAIRAAKGEHA